MNVPITEAQERMAVLGTMHVLDSESGPSLDRVTALAAFAFDAPVAFVSIVGEDKQRFISRIGLPVAETDIRVSVCAHAIACNEVMVVPDLRQDPRFQRNPLVVAPPHLRFYAGAPLVAKNGVAIGAMCIMDTQVREFSESDRAQLSTLAQLVMAQLELRNMSGRLEPVSGMPNRHQFHIDYAGLAQRHGGQRVFAVLLDVFDIPRANEAGQALGMRPLEALIRRAGVRLKLALEGLADVYHVGVTRFAFMVALPSAKDIEGLVGELRQRMSRPLMAAAVPMSPRFHAGICAVTLGEDTSDDVIRKMLIGLHESFEARQAFAWYSEQRDHDMRRAYRLAADAERGLRKDEFHLEYQPRYRASDLQPVSAEALLRWTHPRLGPVSPGEFIPIFERTALMATVTPWVLDAALDQMVAWRDVGYHVLLSFNLSGADLSSEDAWIQIRSKLEARLLPFDSIEIEITEGEWLRADSVAGRQIQAMADAGIKVAIDDFGSGYSNFGYLSDLPINTIKMDKSLIENLESDPKAKPKVAAIINLARELGYHTVAEGVETAAQLQFLRENGCDEIQGYVLSKALSAEALLEVFRSHNAEQAESKLHIRS
ncbi:sensor domain-containing phosphodiesterase [Stenotrophomonas rhizophila]|uniref:bifunctional diguanylate cyclase/phosphodiesterase n=1 Tax=Stenotrophomonas rhizophila TaxID=216778 RepID=UPI00201CB0FD|nr:sensor domain-containing phosphodiesterase [Stenotrophomonas rhizophila]UQY86211.1 sensor domain-containing phosphodiesterase [Stenotrophomonas rhizophila]